MRLRVIIVAIVGGIMTMLMQPSVAPAAHVQCGEVITHSTVLDNDLLGCPGDGIVIGSSDITLDLNGHTIEGDGTGIDVGIKNGDFAARNAYSDVTIRGGSIRQFDIGLRLDGAHRNILRELNISTALDAPDGTGVDLSASSENRIEDVSISSNRTGISLLGSDANRIRRNFATANGRGIDVEGARNDVEKNIANGNFGVGISLTEGTSNSVKGNVASDNGASGRFSAGIVVERSSADEVIRNFTSGNSVGILLSEAVGVRVVGNRVSRADEDGIRVDPNSDDTVLRRNTSDRNGDDGIDIESPGTTVTQNSANSNFDFGIEAIAGVIDGGGNSASGNGNPEQCLNVACGSGRRPRG